MLRTTSMLALALALSSPARADDAPATPTETPGESPSDPPLAPGEAPARTAPGRATARRESAPVPTSDSNRVLYALGLRGRYLAVPGFMLDPFLLHHTELHSGGVGLEFTRRKGQLDIVLSLDFSWYNPPNGNFLGKNKDPALDSHYTEFRGLSFLSLDVAFIWVHDLAPWIAIMLGGGVGIGVVFGDIWTINNSSQVCTRDNAGDPSKCYPVSRDSYVNAMGQTVEIGAIRPSDPDFQRKLDATSQAQVNCMKTPGADCRDTSGHPYYHKSEDKPPVMVVVNFILGFKFKLHRHFNFNVSGGFRDGFIVGGGPEYVF